MELFILPLLIILSGLFAMAEIAIVSSRKIKLKHLSEKGDMRAQRALRLANNPNHVLATAQLGITFVGIFAGAFGGERIAARVTPIFAHIPLIGAYGYSIAFTLVVTGITFISLVIGELVPKRFALSNPERIAMRMAGFMEALSSFSYPIVRLLSQTTDWILGLIGSKAGPEVAVSEDEVRMLIREGARMGVFNLTERDIVERTFRLSDKKVTSLMTPRKEIQWIDADAGKDQIADVISKYSYSYYPVCRSSLDKVIGVIRTKEVMTKLLTDPDEDYKKYIRKPNFIPESMDAWKVLELFKKSGIHVAMVVDEYGSIKGLLSMTDILEELVGDIPTIDETEDKAIVKRENGTFLVDGLVSVDEFKEAFNLKSLPDEDNGEFHTIGGFAMHSIRNIPKTGDSFVLGPMHIEIVDMDGNRVDKLLVKNATQNS